MINGMKKYLWFVPFLLICAAFASFLISINYWFTISPLLLLLALILNFFIPKGYGRKFNFGFLIIVALVVILFVIFFFLILMSGELHPEGMSN